MNEVTKLLRDIVAIPSINPAFALGDNKLAGEEPVARHLITIAKCLGEADERIHITSGRRLGA